MGSEQIKENREKRTKNKGKIACLSLFIVNCVPTNNYQPTTTNSFASFRDVPGVTAEEIAAIEALQDRYTHFVYGTDHTTEAFPVYSGQEDEVGGYVIGGYAARLCGWLTDLFGIPFVPTLYTDDWDNLLAEFEIGNVHFMGDLMPTEERRKNHFMTGTIAERSLTAYQIAGRSSIAEIAKSRPPRLAFPRHFAPHNIAVKTAEYTFESVIIENFDDAYRLLANGEVDAFIGMDNSEPSMYRHGNVVSETFFPLIFSSASLSTRKADLEPVISVVQKALENGGRSYLAELHNRGRYDYIRNNLFRQLTSGELDYIRNNTVVNIVSEADNYPLSFYNDKDNEYQGIAFDVLKEIELITGLSFEIVKAVDMGVGFRELTDMVENNEASFIAYLRRSKERENRFLFTRTPIIRDYPVLISKSEFPNIHFNDLSDVTVGLVRGAVHSQLFKRWFPENTNFREYDNLDSGFRALKSGAVDMLMSGATYFFSIENYKELAGYKINVVFDHHYDLTIGLNKNENILCAILDKALQHIDLEAISGNWMSKRYDYRAKVSQAQRPWLIGATALSLAVLALILVLFSKSRDEGRRLKKMVAEKNSTLSAIFNTTPDIIFCKDIDSHITECNRAYETHFNVRRSDIGGKNYRKTFDDQYPDLVKQYMDMDKKVINEGQSFIVEEYIPTPDGRRVLFETIKTPLIQDGKITGLVGMSRDISRRKAAEEESKNASEAKSLFLANMSREMRTPMNVIIGFTDLLIEQEDVQGKKKEMLEKISAAGDTLLGLIDSMLDISKIEAGHAKSEQPDLSNAKNSEQ
jgi:PAS domain S-box-containing protein